MRWGEQGGEMHKGNKEHLAWQGKLIKLKVVQRNPLGSTA